MVLASGEPSGQIWFEYLAHVLNAMCTVLNRIIINIQMER